MTKERQSVPPSGKMVASISEIEPPPTTSDGSGGWLCGGWYRKGTLPLVLFVLFFVGIPSIPGACTLISENMLKICKEYLFLFSAYVANYLPHDSGRVSPGEGSPAAATTPTSLCLIVHLFCY